MTYLVRQLGHLVMETADLEAVRQEGEKVLGLRTTHHDGHSVSLSSNARCAEITYRHAKTNGVYSIGLEAYDSAGVAEIYRRCRQYGFNIVSKTPLAPGAEDGFVFEAPFGHYFEIHTPVPHDTHPQMATPRPVQLERLDHVNILVDDPVVMRETLANLLGMKLSDKSDGDEWQFMRAGDLMHHTLGLIKGAPGLHHYSFEASTMMDLVHLADGLSDLGRSVLWGPGHHGANAQSYFSYHRDAVGCIVELTYRMNRIEDDATYEPGVWPSDPCPEDYWLNLWGAPPPEMYAKLSLPLSQRPGAHNFAKAA